MFWIFLFFILTEGKAVSPYYEYLLVSIWLGKRKWGQIKQMVTWDYYVGPTTSYSSQGFSALLMMMMMLCIVCGAIPSTEASEASLAWLTISFRVPYSWIYNHHLFFSYWYLVCSFHSWPTLLWIIIFD